MPKAWGRFVRQMMAAEAVFKGKQEKQKRMQ